MWTLQFKKKNWIRFLAVLLYHYFWNYLYCMHILKAVCLLCTLSDILYKLNTCTKLKDCAWVVIFDQICEQSVLNASSNHNSMCIYIKPSLQMTLFYFHCFGLQHGSKHLAWTFSFNPIKSIYSFNKFFTVRPKKCI